MTEHNGSRPNSLHLDSEANANIAQTTSSPTVPRALPADLPTSLNDRRTTNYYAGETELYDGWGGTVQYISAPAATSGRPLAFDLSLDGPVPDDDIQARLEDSERGFMNNILSSRPAHSTSDEDNDDEVAANKDLSKQEKQAILQKSLGMAASNGDTSRVGNLVNNSAKEFVNVNQIDEDGTVPLIYASCFGHEGVVKVLLDAGAEVNLQDKNGWSALMWSVMNRHKIIARLLLDHGANSELRSTSGGTAWDFVLPNSDLAHYLHEGGYNPSPGSQSGGLAGGDDFYTAGADLADEKFENIVAENESKRRMLMQESAANLEVDLSTLGFDDSPQVGHASDDDDDEEEFVWERCVGDQMFVFQDDKMDLVLDTIITKMTPKRSPNQKPVPANLIFLMARYAHYHMTGSLLDVLLAKAMDLINEVIEQHQWDMTMLAFWISNATLLLHYLKKDAGLLHSTTRYQVELAEMINEAFILVIRDAERRMNKILDAAMLDHEPIPGLDVEYQGEWKVFKSKPKTVEDDPNKRIRPPSPNRRAQVSPRNITSLLSSTLFVLDLYDVHSVITTQILAQLLYWIGAELFNRVITTRKYLARNKAMQVRMNISAIEDWARSNNRRSEHYDNGTTSASGESTVESADRHLAPVVQLLRWLQRFSSLGDDHATLVDVLTQFQRLSPTQLLHVVKNYRYEVDEKSFPKAHLKFLQQLQKGSETLLRRPVTPVPGTTAPNTPIQSPATSNKPTNGTSTQPPPAPSIPTPLEPDTDPPYNKNRLTLDQSMMLPFSLPTSTDMLISYGAGIGGTNRDRARKYIPTVPTEVLANLNLDGDMPRGRSGSIATQAKVWTGNGY